MKIYYVGLLYDYGEVSKGYSYEHDNLENGFRDWALANGHEFESFYPDHSGDMTRLRNAPLADVIFHVAFNESLDLPLDVAQKYLQEGKEVIQWDCDSSYRFGNWILPRKNRVSTFVTTHNIAVPWYQQNDMRVIKSQWGGSKLHNKVDLPKKYDVSFIGQKHGIRPNIIKELNNAGIKVDLFGDYWDGHPDWRGRLPDTQTVSRTINHSRINLNLQNPWQPGTPQQIKGRMFQIPQCGGFQLSTPADDVESYFEPEKEIVIASTMSELVSKIKFYLENSDEREKIADAGYERMMRDHQWSNRFEELFSEL